MAILISYSRYDPPKEFNLSAEQEDWVLLLGSKPHYPPATHSLPYHLICLQTTPAIALTYLSLGLEVH